MNLYTWSTNVVPLPESADTEVLLSVARGDVETFQDLEGKRSTNTASVVVTEFTLFNRSLTAASSVVCKERERGSEKRGG